MSRRSVAVVVTRLQAGAGGVALRGALALDPSRYETTMIAGDTANAADSDGSGDGMLQRAVDAGFRVIRMPDLVPQIAPGTDARALRILTGQLASGTSTWCTPTAPRPARSAGSRRTGRRAEGGAHLPRLPVPTPSSPRPRRAALRRVERWLARLHRHVPRRRRGGRGRGGPPGQSRRRTGSGS